MPALLFTKRALLIAVGCGAAAAWAISETKMKDKAETGPVRVRWVDEKGKPTAPFTTDRVVKTDAEWKKQLDREAYEVARGKGTERPFCGVFYDHKKAGIYTCVCCDLPLFTSAAKFDSGTGWPSFFSPFSEENVQTETDVSHGMVRSEILCRRCGAHLGHVFEDGPRPTGLRFCLNSVSLTFVPQEKIAEIAAKQPSAAAAVAQSAK